MPNPKRRHSKTRRDKRRTHYKAMTATTTVCPNCGFVRQPHRACGECGYYNGRKIVASIK